jgi:outer membrane receptor protein involved in Fe transport
MRSHYEGTSLSRGIEIRRLDGTLARTIQFSDATSQDVDGTDVALFAQDRWRIAPALTLEGGLRADRDGVTEKTGISPRLGISITPGEKKTTVIRGGGGVFYQRTPLNVAAFESYETRRITTMAADGITEQAPALQLTPVTGDLALASSVIWNVGFDHQLTPTLTFRANHLRRRGSHETILDPRMTPGDAALVLASDGKSRYWEQETTVRYQAAPKYDLTFSYVWSRARADANNFDAYFGNARAPIIQPNAYTVASTDVPHRLIVWGSLSLLENWEVLPLFEVRSGFPYSAIDALQDIVGTRNGAGRFPMLASLDLSVQRRLKVRNRNIRVGVRAYNLLNRPAYRDVQANLSAPTYGQFSNPVERSFGATLWIER